MLSRAATRISFRLNIFETTRSSSIWIEKNIPNTLYRPLPLRSISRRESTQQIDYVKMVDPKRVVSYEDMLKVIQQPEKVIIDVRNPEEVKSTGKIPSSINIPLDNVHDVLASMSNEEFQRNYKRNKPASSDELIFYCQSGRRSSEALDKALKLGYSKSKTYHGSWNDWSNRHQK